MFADDPSDTAHIAWDKSWQTNEGRADWLNPEAEVLDCMARLRTAGFKTALDLGCGVGRHSLAMAMVGFETSALDASNTGLLELQRSAETHQLTISTHQGRMTELPFPNETFDYVLSWNVIYHGDQTIVEQTIGEIHRVLRRNGIFQGTMLSKRRHDYGHGHEISANTFVQPGADGDKAHPHFFCSGQELVGLLSRFELRELKDIDGQNGMNGNWHWYFRAERR